MVGGLEGWRVERLDFLDNVKMLTEKKNEEK